MKAKNLIVYAIILAVLGGVYWVYDVRLAGDRQREATEKAKIFNLNFDQVTRVVSKVGDREFRIERDPGTDEWRMTEPVDTPADRWAVEGMVVGVLEAEKDRVLENSGSNLAEYGLDKPSAQLTLSNEKGPLAPTLFLGGTNPMGFLSYARLGDEKDVFTVTAPVRQDLTHSLYDLRDKSLVLIPGEKVDRIRIEGRGVLALERRGIRNWDVVDPDRVRADADVVQRILYAGLKSRAVAFVPPGALTEDFGFEQPRMKITAVSKGRRVELTIGHQRQREEPEKNRRRSTR